MAKGKAVRKVIRHHLRRIANRALRKRAIRRIVKKGRRTKRLNFVKPRHGSIMLV